jgi:mRNA-degrading endonuclease RelE of RelBE toxin-antitoxin system
MALVTWSPGWRKRPVLAATPAQVPAQIHHELLTEETPHVTLMLDGRCRNAAVMFGQQKPGVRQPGSTRAVPYELRYSPEAGAALKRLRPFDRSAVIAALEEVLVVNPTLESKARVKRLREPAPTQFRLRVRDYRVFYNVKEEVVYVVRILTKREAADYLKGS